MTRFLFLTVGLVCLIGLTSCNQSEDPEFDEPEDPNKPGIILLRYKAGSESTTQREDGFLKELRKNHPDIHILSSEEFAGTSPNETIKVAGTLITKYGDRIQGIFAVCEPNAEGVLKVLKDRGLDTKVKFIGFDPTPAMVRAMREDIMHGIVLQDPVKMGRLAVETMVAHLEGEKVKKRVSTGEHVATPENLKTDEMKKLLFPDAVDEDYQPKGEPKYTIAVIPKGTGNVFWKSVRAGASQAARNLEAEGIIIKIEWNGPQGEGNTEEQMQIVQSFVTRKVDGICLAPNDSQALVKTVKAAKEAGIPTVIYDSGLIDQSVYVSYVATDNRNGGKLAAKRLAEVLSEETKVPSEK